jgi:hypothetical protein
MSKKIRIIVIDPHLKTICESEIENTLKGLQHAIDNNNIELVYLDKPNIMYVDDEGLFKENQQFFLYNRRPFAGKAIVLGDDPKNGNTVGTKSTILEIASHVEFRTVTEISQMGLG